MRKFAAAVGMVILSVFMIASITAGAAEKKVKSEVVMKVGNKVHLFHSGTPDVKRSFSTMWSPSTGRSWCQESQVNRSGAGQGAFVRG